MGVWARKEEGKALPYCERQIKVHTSMSSQELMKILQANWLKKKKSLEMMAFDKRESGTLFQHCWGTFCICQSLLLPPLIWQHLLLSSSDRFSIFQTQPKYQQILRRLGCPHNPTIDKKQLITMLGVHHNLPRLCCHLPCERFIFLWILFDQSKLFPRLNY